MDNTKKTEISLKVNNALVILRNGKLVSANAYRTTSDGIYILADNVGQIFNFTTELIPSDEKKLCFITNAQIEAIIYDVEGDLAAASAEQSPAPTAPANPQG